MKRLRFVLSTSPRVPARFRHDPEAQVSFAPMDALDDGLGGLRLSETRAFSELLGGSYNYFENGDVLLAKVTPCFENGKKAIASGLENGAGFATSEVLVFRPRSDGIDTRYLRYLFCAEDFRHQAIASMTGAGGLRRVSERAVLDYVLPVCDLETQRQIADYLDRETARIDLLIEKKQRLVTLLGEKRSAILERSISTTPAEVVPFRRILKRIEQGWSPDCLAKLVEGEEWGILKVGCVNGWSFNSKEHKTLPENMSPRPELEVVDGDLLMSRANTPELVGSVAIVRNPPPRLMLCDKLYRLVLDERAILSSFAVMVLRSRNARDHYSASSNGASSSMQNISQETVRSLGVPVLSLAEQRRRVDQFEHLSAHVSHGIELCHASIDRLKEYRSALITAAVTGQIDVGAAARLGAADRRLDALHREMDA